MAYLLLDTLLEPTNSGASCGPEFISWTIGLLGVELERVNEFSRGHQALTGEDALYEFMEQSYNCSFQKILLTFSFWRINFCLPLAIGLCQEHGNTWWGAMERQGMRDEGRR